ncbi:uncharacterized protein LOC117318468 [Pecten maximus]|uniref:uncharacterized protein LOC117318468 n=1 Tax=Pecten maximus TaxID=6579 RepID=UPI0014584C1F|nr:uncharacterized protein LOC117318468 [Pecten maximus]
MAGQLAVRSKGSTKCCHHKTENVVFVCKEDGCNNDLACIKCVTSVHKKHDLENLSTVIEGKKNKIRQFVRTAEQQDSANIDLVIQATELKLEKNSEKFKSIQDQMKKHAQECKDEIDLVVKEFLVKCSKEEDGNKATLENYKEKLKETKEKLNDRIRKCKTTLQRGTDVEIFDTEIGNVDQRVTIPDTPTLSVSEFEKCEGYKLHLDSAFGKWKYKDENCHAQFVIRSP